jgi:hypothetical protein
MTTMTKEQALACKKLICDYYSSFDGFEEYMIIRKREWFENSGLGNSLFGLSSWTSLLFNEPDMAPMDMNIKLVHESEYTHNWYTLARLVSSMYLSSSPGRSIRYFVREENTQKILGFIKMNSPSIMMGPRKNAFGDMDLNEVNRSVISGYVIVPTQPFGFNCLGGKLLSLLCVSEQVRDDLNSKYKDMDLKYFETTSLYGSIKQVSQYDGLKPFIRHGGSTDSKFMMFPSDEVYKKMKSIMIEATGEKYVVNPNASSKKLRTLNKIIATVKRDLVELGLQKELDELNIALSSGMQTNTKKRYYYGNIGYETERVVDWWKKKAQKRWEKLRSEDRLRRELEVWDQKRFSEKQLKIIR